VPVLTTIAFYLGVIAYSVSATLFFADLARREGWSAAARWAPRALGVGAALHATHVVTASLLSHVCPVESLHFALSLAALIAATLFLIVRKRLRLQAIGAFVAAVALMFLVGAQFVTIAQPGTGMPRALLAMHVTANLLGLSLFLLAGTAGVFYLVQERQLKGKRAGWLMAKLPPLDSLDMTEHRLLLAGFPLLTFGVVTGAVVAAHFGHSSDTEMVRAALSYTTWFVVAGVLILRALAGWRGRRAAYGTIAGVVCVLLVLLLYVIQPVGGGV
jgi:ABC-type uncharacterized transport system permease subunit